MQGHRLKQEPTAGQLLNNMSAPASLKPAVGLRLATHNVSGLTSAAKVMQLVELWGSLGLHIVCVQETWADRSDGQPASRISQWLLEAAEALHRPAPLIVWANNSQQHHRAGVAT